MAIVEGSSFSDLASEELTEDDRLLEYTMDFVFAVEDRLDELGMTRAELARKLGCKKSRVTHVLSGSGNITLRTVARYDAALGLGFRLTPRNQGYTARVEQSAPSAPWRQSSGVLSIEAGA